MSERTYFGTDGIRGKANTWPMTAEIALKAGMAAGLEFQRGPKPHRVVIGKDTRLSGYLLEPALTSGFIAVGMDVVLVGPLPTPAVAMLTRSLRADLGVMISASHNPYEDNGIKLFGPDGFKLSDETESRIEGRMNDGMAGELAAPQDLGRATRLDDAVGRYIEHVKACFPKGLGLEGMKIVVDCAHGAAYRVAPTILHELGAEVVPIGVKPDGYNINLECGSTAPDAMCRAVVEHKADIGLALDGDADRIVMADETGSLVDGDQLLAVIADSWREAGRLSGDSVVATVMSNIGLEDHLQRIGIGLIRTQVGDRYVVERMTSEGLNLGGEQSGHIVLGEYTTTGDGLMAALQALAAMVQAGAPASEVLRPFAPAPQILKSIPMGPGRPLEAAAVKAAIADGESRLKGKGRLLIRESGTEPLVRIMAEGPDEQLIGAVVEDLATAIGEAASVDP
ncbi:MAG TPA: phosphoglucosamine mutase [Alphaproteobacteria bacterium]|nr:phosphoglucosamine mutase [Alphaproteobacteria bacterium]